MTTPPMDLTSVGLPQMLFMQSAAADELARAKAVVAGVKAELQSRYGANVKQALDQLDKTHGSVTLAMQDGISLKTETKQTVKWDSAKLQAVAQSLPWERVVALFKIDFSMSETIYKGIAAMSPELREKIDAARTTTIGEPVITLVKDAA